MSGKVKIMQEYITNSMDLVFEWGVCDCTLWVDAYLDKLGFSIHPYKGKYSSKEEALKLRKQTPVSEVMDKHFTRTLMPERGDIAMLKDNLALGIVSGHKVAFKAEADGLVMRNFSDCSNYWSIKCDS